MENIYPIDLKRGLTNEQVKQRTARGLANISRTKTSKSYTQIIVGNLFSWFNVICFLLAGALIAVGSYQNLIFMVVFLANLMIGILQEVKAKKIVDKIAVIYETRVSVMREGEITHINVNEVVLDDIILFKNGNQVCADCEILDGEIEVNESMLTGESKPIKKSVGDKIFGGSFVVSGTCTARATNVGKNTYSSTLVKKAKQIKANQSEILKTLNIIIKSIGVILIPLGILTFVDTYTKQNLSETITKTAASIIGMMPVGMFLLTSVSLVVGVINLAKKKTLVQDLYCIEMLARANVLCLDKTGTLTDGTMVVRNVLPLNCELDKIDEIMASYVAATKTENLTNDALARRFLLNYKGSLYESKAVLEFSSERKFSAVKLNKLGTFMLGAPEFVTNNLDKDSQQTIKNLTQDGFRVLVLCKSNERMDDKMSKDNTPISLFAIEDNIRPDAKKTVEWFQNNGVEVKVISGDNIDTVSNICKKVGIKGYDSCISLEGLPDEKVMEIANQYNIFGRVSPEQKCLLIKSMRKSGKKVAMTGDGVNDILAFKESDCSIAMASGSEATRSASNIIMLENSFSSMPNIVSEGRRVINNISKASSLFLTKTFFTMFLTIFVLVSRSYIYPLEPNQIFMWETFFIGIPAFLLALQPSNQPVKGSFIASLTSKALPGAIVLFLGAIGCYVYCGITSQQTLLPTLISYTATFGAATILLNMCLPLNKFRGSVFLSMVVACLVFLLAIPKNIFNYLTITSKELVFILISVLLIACLYVFLKWLFEKFFKYNKKIHKKMSN